MTDAESKPVEEHEVSFVQNEAIGLLVHVSSILSKRSLNGQLLDHMLDLDVPLTDKQEKALAENPFFIPANDLHEGLKCIYRWFDGYSFIRKKTMK